MSSCVFPGSFDPITCGHMDIIHRASVIFDQVTVAVMINREKKGFIPFEERVRILKKACCKLGNVKIDMWDGLLAEYMKIHSESIIVRGVRSAAEFEQEKAAASINKRLYPNIETILLPSCDTAGAISSSVIREIASFGGNYHGMIPECVYDDIEIWLKLLKH